jgi:hypothetical protein
MNVKQTEKSNLTCPECQSNDVECLSMFGERLMTSKYCCKTCKLYFDTIRWE